MKDFHLQADEDAYIFGMQGAVPRANIPSAVPPSLRGVLNNLIDFLVQLAGLAAIAKQACH